MRAAVSSAGWSPARREAALTSVEFMHVILSVEGSPMGHSGTYPREAGNRRLRHGLLLPASSGEPRAVLQVGLTHDDEGADDVGGEHGRVLRGRCRADLSSVLLRGAAAHREDGV